MSFEIALNFEDGVTRVIQCRPDETVADAAYRQKVNVPIDCRDGACGTCKCRAEAGRYRLGDHIDDALTAEEGAEGYVLTCQMYPQSDCVVQVPASSKDCKAAPAGVNVTVASVQRLSDTTFALTLAGDGLQRLSFLPGQYANLGVPGTTSHRAYSFSMLPREGRVSFLIRNVPGGLMSRWLEQQASAGDPISLTGPYGSFYLRAVTRPVLMLAGGTGLAPFLAMLDKLVAEGGSSHPIHLLYGVNSDADLVELERLQAFQAALPGFRWDAVVVDPASRQPRKGYVTQHLGAKELHDGEVDIYLCGPPPMVEAVSSHLREQGISPRAFHYEKFAASH